jgi:riboflavin transporter FmnP
MMIYSIILLMLELVGLTSAAAFLFQHRPKSWRRLPALDAMGFPAIVVIVFIRSVVLTLINFPIPGRPIGQMTFSLATLLAVDVVLLIKLANFRAFLREDRDREQRIVR